ncbi:hypothetical protein LOZ58_000192 [Ophidiomyces ophidiicola]|nr:hypothetical protein LOZ58_000192 [Ophidiomyces ophidiicola]
MKSFLVASTLLTSTLATAIPASPYAPYRGEKVFTVKTTNSNHARLQSIVNDLSLTAWEMPRKAGPPADIIVPQQKVRDFQKATEGMDVKVMYDDFANAIEAECAIPEGGDAESTNLDTWFKSYHPYEAHMRFLTDLQQRYSQNSEILEVGKSYENRTISAIRIFGDGRKDHKKPPFLFLGTTHAREWVTTPTVEYMAVQLLQGKDQQRIRHFLSKYDFYIITIQMALSIHSNLQHRQINVRRDPGVKIASPTEAQTQIVLELIPTVITLGNGWEMVHPPTHVRIPSELTVVNATGRSQGDAPEIAAQVEFAKKIAVNGKSKMFVDWHSYSGMFLTPYGYSCDKLPPNHQQHMNFARRFVEGVKATHGLDFVYGPTCKTIYGVNGASSDWAYDVGKFEFGFAAELRPTRSQASGLQGFLLPPEQIIAACEETWAGFMAGLGTI